MNNQAGNFRPGKGVRRVILLERDETGSLVPETLWSSKKSKKKKGSKNLRGVERAIRGAGKAQQAFTDTLMKRHRRSNRKRKNGWLRDFGSNVGKAQKKSMNRLSKSVK